MSEHKCQLFVKSTETWRNHIKSWFNHFPYKTRNISQNLTHDLNILKTGKSKLWFKMSSKMAPKMSLYKKNLSDDDSKYPTISHKKCFVPNVDMLNFVVFFWMFMYIYIYIHIIIYLSRYHTFQIFLHIPTCKSAVAFLPGSIAQPGNPRFCCMRIA